MTLLHLLVLGCVLGSTLGQANHPYCTIFPEGTGLLPHLDKLECRKYITCYKGDLTIGECPAGTFHLKCPPYDQCLSPFEIGKHDPSCKCQDVSDFCKTLPDGTGFLPYPDVMECHKYISCYKGHSAVPECQGGAFHLKCAPYDQCLPEADIDKLDPSCKCYSF